MPHTHATRLARTATLTLALTLCACTTVPPAPLPDGGVPVPTAWSRDATVGPEPLAQWWTRFGDPLLVQLVDASLRASTDVRTAQANLRQARALRDVAAAALWPTVGVSLSGQRGRVAGADNSNNLFVAGFDASWEPDLFGAGRHAAGAAEALSLSSEATLAATEVSIAAEVALDYLQLRGTQARIAFARDNLEAQQQTLQITQWREQAGLGTSLETAQAQSAVEQTRAALPTLEATVATTSHAIAVLTGQPPAALDAQLKTVAALPQPPAGLAVDIPARTLRQRPDVQAAEFQLEAAAQRVAQADAQLLPAAQVSATLAWSGVTLGSIGSISAARSLIASIGQTLFDHGQRSAQRDAQQAAFDAAQEGYRASVLAALRDVEDALAALAASRERMDALHSAVRASRDAALLATQRYQGGLIDFQTVLDTQRNLLLVQDSVASAETDFTSNHVRLYKALGGGWRPAPRENGS